MNKREFKFRAYSKNSKTILSWDFINSVGSLTKLLSLNHVDVMQYTGLKDKNEKEIYEGDIIKTPTEKLMVIAWSEKKASFVILRKDWMFVHYFGEAIEPEDCEVVGNIYENEYLLSA